MDNTRQIIKIVLGKTIKKLRNYSEHATEESNRDRLAKVADEIEDIIDRSDTNE